MTPLCLSPQRKAHVDAIGGMVATVRENKTAFEVIIGLAILGEIQSIPTNPGKIPIAQALAVAPDPSIKKVIRAKFPYLAGQSVQRYISAAKRCVSKLKQTPIPGKTKTPLSLHFDGENRLILDVLLAQDGDCTPSMKKFREKFQSYTGTGKK